MIVIKNIKKKKIFFIILLLFLPMTTQAVGIAVEPAKLKIYSSDKEYYLNIENISAEPITVFIYSDDFENNIIIYPDNINLSTQQKTRIKIYTNFSENKEKILSTNISLVSKALNKKSFNASSGIKIPITIYIEKTNNLLFPILGSLILIFLLAIIFIYMPHIQKKESLKQKIKRIVFKKSKNKDNFWNFLNHD
ncbi:hypothetical protein K8R66_02030 [bacterium]|nr:hypothetical protein [bacterium]